MSLENITKSPVVVILLFLLNGVSACAVWLAIFIIGGASDALKESNKTLDTHGLMIAGIVARMDENIYPRLAALEASDMRLDLKIDNKAENLDAKIEYSTKDRLTREDFLYFQKLKDSGPPPASNANE